MKKIAFGKKGHFSRQKVNSSNSGIGVDHVHNRLHGLPCLPSLACSLWASCLQTVRRCNNLSTVLAVGFPQLTAGSLCRWADKISKELNPNCFEAGDQHLHSSLTVMPSLLCLANDVSSKNLRNLEKAIRKGKVKMPSASSLLTDNAPL